MLYELVQAGNAVYVYSTYVCLYRAAGGWKLDCPHAERLTDANKGAAVAVELVVAAKAKTNEVYNIDYGNDDNRAGECVTEWTFSKNANEHAVRGTCVSRQVALVVFYLILICYCFSQLKKRQQ